ncbi:hypothetical protein Tco_0872905 [Tanacetum coccineum]
MADHLRPMEELHQIPIVCIEDAIVVPAVLANKFELKIELLDFISNNPFFGLDNDDPHSHIKRFYQITQTLKLNQVPHDVVKLILFSFSLKGAAETWLKNEPPNSITTWDDLVSKNKPQVSSSGGTSTQIDAITALTKKVKALEYHIASMRETYDHNQEAAIQLMQNQMGQMAEALQENPLGVLSSNTVTDPRAELKAITTMDGLTLDGSFIPHSNFLVYQEKEQEPETITEVVEISSSQITPLVLPPETPPLSTPKMKENLEPNPHQPPIPCPSRYYEAFCFNVNHQKEKSSGSSTSYFDHSLPDYEAFCFDIDHHEEKSSGSTISHYHPSLLEYESFYFNLSIDPLPPAEGVILVMRSSQMNSLTSYLHWREFTRVLKENIFDLSTKGLTINELNDSSLLLSDCDSSLSKEFYEIDLLVSFPSGMKT